MKMDVNKISALTDALANVLQYANNDVSYPDLDGVRPDEGVVAEWFYPVFNGSNDFSELSAIMLYTGQEAKFEDIGELMLGIGLIEMKHYDKLQDLIRKLGGSIERKYSSAEVQLGATVVEALDNAIAAEEKTIAAYMQISYRILDETPTAKIVRDLLKKLISDEELHKRLLSERKALITPTAE